MVNWKTIAEHLKRIGVALLILSGVVFGVENSVHEVPNMVPVFWLYHAALILYLIGLYAEYIQSLGDFFDAKARGETDITPLGVAYYTITGIIYIAPLALLISNYL